MNSSIFVKVLEYFVLPRLEEHLLVYQIQSAYQPAAVCIDAIFVLKENVMHYKLKRSDVYYAEVNLSKAYDRNNTSFFYVIK